MYERSYLAKVERPAQAAPQTASGPRSSRYRLPLRLIADCGFRLRPDENVSTYNDSRLPTRSKLMRAHPAYDPEMLVGSWISQVSYRQHACGFYSTLDMMYVCSDRSSDKRIGRLACKQLTHIGEVGETTPHLRF